jgi:hypothetical protein
LKLKYRKWENHTDLPIILIGPWQPENNHCQPACSKLGIMHHELMPGADYYNEVGYDRRLPHNRSEEGSLTLPLLAL